MATTAQQHFACGSILCDVTGCLKRCARCKARSYCSKACQRQDWSAHRQACGVSTDDGDSVEDRIITAYDRQHSLALLRHALTLIFGDDIASKDREVFRAHAERYMLFVVLRPVRDKTARKWNKARFLSAQLMDLEALPDARVARIRERINHPSRPGIFTFAYALQNVEDTGKPHRSVTSITHAVHWDNHPHFFTPFPHSDLSRALSYAEYLLRVAAGLSRY